MKLDMKILKTMSPLEMILFGLFIIYLVFPIHTPDSISGVINSPVGLIVMFMVTLYLFIYTNPILGLMYIFVAYELLRRSHSAPTYSDKPSQVVYAPSQEHRKELKMNPPAHTLEEDVVNKMAPIGHGSKVTYVDTPFKPISENTHNAFKI